MAFDKATRNALQKFVARARRLLSEEFTRQLQASYGMDPTSGAVADMAALSHLDNQQQQTAAILRETLHHYLAITPGKSAQERSQQVLERMVREQAFTLLNRLAALRMAESRGVLFESLARGQASQGFQLYQMVAGPALGEVGDVYRQYLLSLFDELGQDLPDLFDRHSPQGLLFPKDSVLLDLLDAINHPDIAHLWAEDETIGWIYQYYNDPDERKAMRAASAAPRNSRELAVRNQFFTPRYVVEFLTDNTLGRLWFNATDGHTRLRETCRYLLIKPDAPLPPVTRPRDPRTLKWLDPACGSMHFGLYAFDLFLPIYRDAWDWEQQHGAGSLDTSSAPDGAFAPLSQRYPDEMALQRDLPRLIIEHNLHGVDIDPRAAQIAALALWLRAQRAWHEAGVAVQDRPPIGRGHVLAAVAPPAEPELRAQLAEQLDFLDADLFARTLQLLEGLPELGVLLQAERALPRLIREVYGEHGPMFRDADQAQWHQAEERLRRALTDFAQTAHASYQARLFAQDALAGLRLIDLCRQTFDVVVMNPPFGALAAGTKERLGKAYPRSKNDLLAVMVERGLELLRPGGRLGAITSRTCFFLSSFQKWREGVVLGLAEPEVMADLGHGVMDDAMVEAAAYCLVKT
ncbi:Eco57I restriction-modification methylase domain-containing protein [Thiorhodovibrio winogradskyi]|nr:SAM-dependent methyltransferase [Thiorhodovibrio winogradskyi]